MKLRVFECDNCSKLSEPVQDATSDQVRREVFPYSKGWVYIYNLELKIEQGKNINLRDKHFCGMNCLVSKLLKLAGQKDLTDFGRRYKIKTILDLIDDRSVYEWQLIEDAKKKGIPEEDTVSLIKTLLSEGSIYTVDDKCYRIVK